MRLSSLAALFFIGLLPIGTATAETDLQSRVEQTLGDEDLTGIVWTLIEGEGDVLVGAAGLQSVDTEDSVTIDSQFHVGSLTKSVLATGVLQLVSAGRIDIDAPAHRYLPGLFVDSPPAGFLNITVRHLLDHTAGLNDAQLWQVFSEKADPDAPLRAAFPDPVRQLRVRSDPGTQFSYSNIGYTLLGLIIESTVGVRYETYLDEHVLEPLGMSDSTFAFTSQESVNAQTDLVWGHLDGVERYAASPMFLRPAGQFTTTAADLGRFAQFMLGDGDVEGRKLVDKSLMQSRAKPFRTTVANEGLVAGYALGLGRRDRHGVVAYCHGGNIVGFVAMLCIFPEEKKAFAYSVNTDSETANYGRLDSLFIRALDIKDAQQKQASAALDVAEWLGLYVLSPNRFEMFRYLDTLFGAVKLSAEGDSLVLTSLQKDARRLISSGGNFYSANDRATTSHVLFRGDQGGHFIGDGFKTYEKVSAIYLIAHWISLVLGLVGLCWIVLAGSFSLIRSRAELWQQPVVAGVFTSLLLFVPVPFFLNQSFMALGDFTLASALLALVTTALPIGMILTIFLIGRDRPFSCSNLRHGLAALFVLQWCVVLVDAGLLPFRLWS